MTGNEGGNSVGFALRTLHRQILHGVEMIGAAAARLLGLSPADPSQAMRGMARDSLRFQIAGRTLYLRSQFAVGWLAAARAPDRSHMKGQHMAEDDHIAAEALRIMQAFPDVYGASAGTHRAPLLQDGFLCGPGWYPLIGRFSADLSDIIRRDGLTRFRVVQVKEKFGELRFYIKGGNDAALDRIGEAVRQSATTCERCGRPGRIRLIDGWLTTLCGPCQFHVASGS